MNGDSSSPTVWTVGHGTRPTADLAALLREAGVRRVLDVRRYPASRRNPQFAQERLAVELPILGLEYDWWGEAFGGRRAPVSPSRESAWTNAAFRAYAVYMHSDAFRSALADLEAKVAAGERLALMCAETLWWRCHRRLIADALVLDGFQVRHLIDRPPGRQHRPHPTLRHDETGQPVYEAARVSDSGLDGAVAERDGSACRQG